MTHFPRFRDRKVGSVSIRKFVPKSLPGALEKLPSRTHPVRWFRGPEALRLVKMPQQLACYLRVHPRKEHYPRGVSSQSRQSSSRRAGQHCSSNPNNAYDDVATCALPEPSHRLILAWAVLHTMGKSHRSPFSPSGSCGRVTAARPLSRPRIRHDPVKDMSCPESIIPTYLPIALVSRCPRDNVARANFERRVRTTEQA